MGREKDKRGGEKEDEEQREEETGETNDEDDQEDKNEDGFMNMLKPDFTQKTTLSNTHSTYSSTLHLNTTTPGTKLPLRPRLQTHSSNKPNTLPSPRLNPPSDDSGKSGQVQAAASIAALESMSPTSRRIFAGIIMEEMGRKGLVKRKEKRRGIKGEEEMGNSD